MTKYPKYKIQPDLDGNAEPFFLVFRKVGWGYNWWCFDSTRTLDEAKDVINKDRGYREETIAQQKATETFRKNNPAIYV